MTWIVAFTVVFIVYPVFTVVLGPSMNRFLSRVLLKVTDERQIRTWDEDPKTYLAMTWLMTIVFLLVAVPWVAGKALVSIGTFADNYTKKTQRIKRKQLPKMKHIEIQLDRIHRN